MENASRKIEFTRDEKIKKLNERILASAKNSKYWESLIGNSQFSQEGLEENVKMNNLEVQAFELLLYKIKKGERK